MENMETIPTQTRNRSERQTKRSRRAIKQSKNPHFKGLGRIKRRSDAIKSRHPYIPTFSRERSWTPGAREWVQVGEGKETKRKQQ